MTVSGFARFRSGLGQRWRKVVGDQVNLVAIQCVDSTQVWARRLLERHLQEQERPRPFVVIAYQQTEGRGRQRRPWWSASGRGVWGTLVWPFGTRRELESLPLRSAVGLCQTVREFTGLDCRLKWPNDLLIGKEKLAGILVEAILRGSQGYGLVGFGLNVEHAPGELPAGLATSIRCACGRVSVTSEELAPSLVLGITSELVSMDDWHSRYVEWLVHRPGDLLLCRTVQEEFEGRFAGIDEAGFLWVETAIGKRAIRTGDVFEW